MAEVKVTINGNEVNYNSKKCSAADYAAVIASTIYHLKSEFLDKGEDVSEELILIKKSLAMLEG